VGHSLLQLFRSVTRSLLLLAMLLAATFDLLLRRPRFGAEGAVWIHGWCRRIVDAMGINVLVTGSLPDASGGPVAVVSNHLSYLDILLYSAAQPFVMVAKSEVKRWPLLGRLTAQAGTVYVDRGGGPPTYPAVNRAMAEAYKSGLPVLFFPEGTTTDGSEVLPFRRGLFHSVLNNRVELRTAALRYSLGKGNGAATVANDVCWWGDAFFGPHIFRCLGLKDVSARIAFEEGVVDGADRFALSERARDRVAQRFESMARETAASPAAVRTSDKEMISSPS
jgi:1-acyl-sn-glycerol-3-phosphate acyltransferase